MSYINGCVYSILQKTRSLVITSAFLGVLVITEQDFLQIKYLQTPLSQKLELNHYQCSPQH